MQELKISAARANLTPLRRMIYDYLVASFLEKQRLPVLREVCAQFDIPSTSVAKFHFDKLVEAGLLDKEPRGNVSRYKLSGMRVTYFDDEQVVAGDYAFAGPGARKITPETEVKIGGNDGDGA